VVPLARIEIWVPRILAGKAAKLIKPFNDIKQI